MSQEKTGGCLRLLVAKDVFHFVVQFIGGLVDELEIAGFHLRPRMLAQIPSQHRFDECRGPNYTSSSRTCRPTTVAAFCSVLKVIASLSGSSSRSRAERLVCIRRAISTLVKPFCIMAASTWRATTRLMAVALTF